MSRYKTSEPLIPPFLHNKKGHQTLWALWTLCLAPVTHLGCRRDRSSQRYRSKLRWQHHSSHRSDTNTFPGSPAQRNPEDTLKHTHKWLPVSNIYTYSEGEVGSAIKKLLLRFSQKVPVHPTWQVQAPLTWSHNALLSHWHRWRQPRPNMPAGHSEGISQTQLRLREQWFVASNNIWCPVSGIIKAGCWNYINILYSMYNKLKI